MTYVAVCGPGVATAEEERLAEEVGRRLAEAGAIVLCGGTTGAMEAVSRGAAGAGGTVVGILPGLDRAEGNPHLTVAIPTGLGEMRNALLVRAADVVIAIAGELGTLSEIAFALKIGTPVVGLHTWEPARRGARIEEIRRAADPAEAVALALRS